MKDQLALYRKCSKNDVPLFVISAMDVCSVNTLLEYSQVAGDYKCDTDFISDFNEVLAGFVSYRTDESERLENPSIYEKRIKDSYELLKHCIREEIPVIVLSAKDICSCSALYEYNRIAKEFYSPDFISNMENLYNVFLQYQVKNTVEKPNL